MKNIKAKYTAKGSAMRKTSNGISTIICPFKLNITTIVNSKAINVIGETTGINFVVNQSTPFNFIKMALDKNPAKND
jgi:hypothetical protein